MTTTAKPSIENLDRILAQHEAVRHLTPGPDLSQFDAATATLAQLHLFNSLNGFDVVALNKRIEEKPELFFPLINAFCNFSRLKLAWEKFEWQKQQADARQRAREEKQRGPIPVAITIETLRSLKTCLRSTEPPSFEPVDHAITSNNKPPTVAPSPPIEGLAPERTAETVDYACPSVTRSWCATSRSLQSAICSKRIGRRGCGQTKEAGNPARHDSTVPPPTGVEPGDLLIGSPS